MVAVQIFTTRGHRLTTCGGTERADFALQGLSGFHVFNDTRSLPFGRYEGFVITSIRVIDSERHRIAASAAAMTKEYVNAYNAGCNEYSNLILIMRNSVFFGLPLDQREYKYNSRYVFISARLQQQR